MDKGLRVFTVTDGEGKNGCFIEYLEEQCNNYGKLSIKIMPNCLIAQNERCSRK